MTAQRRSTLSKWYRQSGTLWRTLWLGSAYTAFWRGRAHGITKMTNVHWDALHSERMNSSQSSRRAVTIRRDTAFVVAFLTTTWVLSCLFFPYLNVLNQQRHWRHPQNQTDHTDADHPGAGIVVQIVYCYANRQALGLTALNSFPSPPNFDLLRNFLSAQKWLFDNLPNNRFPFAFTHCMELLCWVIRRYKDLIN